MSSKTELVKAELEKNPNPTFQEIKEIAKRCECSTGLVYKLKAKLPKVEPEILEAVEPVIKVKEEEEIEIPIEPEAKKEVEEVVSERIPKRIVEKIEVGVLTEDDLTYVWQSVNCLFPEKHQRPEKSMQLLGKLWVKPANRLIEKYSAENVDLYLAIGGTVLVFSPSVIGMIRERRTKIKKEGEEFV